MPRNRLARWLAALALLLLVFAPLFSGGIDLLVDWLWFNQEGFRVLYVNILKAQIALSSYAGLGFMAVVGLNFFVARTLARGLGRRVYEEVVEFRLLDRLGRGVQWIIGLGILFVGYFVGEWAMTHWNEYLLAQHAQNMVQADPLFNRNLGYYLFRLPFQWFLFYLALVTAIASLFCAFFVYLVEGGVWVTQRGISVARAARAHLMTLGAILSILAAWRMRLAMYNLLYSPRGALFGAGYADVHASLPVLKLLVFFLFLTAAAFLAGAVRGSLRPAVYAVLATVALGFLGGAVYPAIVQRFSVAPNEFEKEKPYIEWAIAFTRSAYALDRFEEREFPAVEDLKLEDIRSNQPTMRNVRLWDHVPLLSTFKQLQELRPYYDFERVDNDRYWLEGTYRQVSLSPRELATSRLPTPSRGWINEHIAYTHGYGLCLGPVNESTTDGLPVLFIKDIPPASTSSTRITRPEIYFGEVANDYSIVRTSQQEFDYAKGGQDVYTSYQGTGGIPVRSFWRKLLLAIKFGEINVLLSGNIQPDSRVMIYRQVLERARRLTPFLRFDHDPYLVVSQEGGLHWMLDGYTTSEMYPYAQPTEGVGNYIRNSVKATISAYDGRVHFYISDAADPLIRAYAEIFPGVFEPLTAMPENLRSHIRYPENFFATQANMYATFHMTDPRVFYNKEDLWRVAQSVRGGNAPMVPYYTIMKLAEVGTTEEFILMVPFTPARKDNMIAWMAARCDAPHYGKVLVFNFPKQKLIYGPQQIESRIDQDSTISPQLSLWDQHGSQVIRGTLLVIPVLNSVLYVEPLYLAAQAGGGLPQLKRVIVAYADKVVMEPTLEEALGKIFGGTVSTAAPARVAAAPAPQAQALSSLIQEANQHYERAQQLLRQGDWAAYGEEMRRLGEVLKRMSK